MSQSVHYEPTSVVSSNDRLLISLFIATIIHALFLLGIHYKAPEANRVSKSIQITLVNTKAHKAPPHARLLAQHNQIGAGQKQSKPEPPKQKMPSPGQPEPKTVAKASEPVKPETAPKILTKKVEPKPTSIAVEKTKTKIEPVEHIEPAPKPRPLLTQENLSMQIAQMGKQIMKDQHSEDDTRIKSINSVSTHEYVAAQYISDWEAKVERTGNLNYPEAARKKNFNGRLTMDVGIKADGSIYSIHISKTSGLPALDDAAKRIVTMSAPFPPLPTDLLKELDVLVITRVWSFSDESGMSAN